MPWKWAWQKKARETVNHHGRRCGVRWRQRVEGGIKFYKGVRNNSLQKCSFTRCAREIRGKWARTNAKNQWIRRKAQNKRKRNKIKRRGMNEKRRWMQWGH